MRYYKVNPRKITLREYWDISPNVSSFLVVALLKAFQQPIPIHVTLGRMETLPMQDFHRVSPGARKAFQPMVVAAERAGLCEQFYYEVTPLEKNRRAIGAAFLSADGLVAGLGVYARSDQTVNFNFSCLSDPGNGRYLITSSSPQYFRSAPEDDIVRVPPRFGAAGALARHAQRIYLAKKSAALKTISRVRLEELVLEREQRHIDFQASRGVYVEMTPEEVQRVRDANESVISDQ